MRNARWLALAPALALTAVSLLAHAQQTPNQKRADELFTQANQLADHGNFAEACPRYEESNSLDPAIGTKFNLADCYEHVGRLATALTLFREVERVAGETGKIERRDGARKRADAIEQIVPRVKIVLAPSSGIPGLVVTLDDKLLARDDLGRLLPLDRGRHTVSANASGRLPWSKTLDVPDPEGRDIVVPELQLSAPATPLPAVVVPVAANDSSGTGARKTLAFASGGVGLAGIVVGSVFGILSIKEHGDYTQACANSVCPSPGALMGAKGSASTALTEGNVSTAGFVVGGVGVAAAVVLWLTAPKKEQARAFEVVPAVGPGFGGGSVYAEW
jgi:hypothetical protein